MRANKARPYIPPPYVPSGPGNLKTPEPNRYLQSQGTKNPGSRLQFPSDNPNFFQTPKGNLDYGEGDPSNIRALSERSPRSFSNYGEGNTSDNRVEYVPLAKSFVAPTHTINVATEQLRIKAAEKVFLKDLKVESIQSWLLALRDFERVYSHWNRQLIEPLLRSKTAERISGRTFFHDLFSLLYECNLSAPALVQYERVVFALLRSVLRFRHQSGVCDEKNRRSRKVVATHKWVKTENKW